MLSYLALFRLHELGVDHYAAMVLGLKADMRMLRLMELLGDDTCIRTWVTDAWCRLYDRSHVTAMFVQPYLPDIGYIAGACSVVIVSNLTSASTEVADALRRRMNAAPAALQVSKTTVPAPFRSAHMIICDVCLSLLCAV